MIALAIIVGIALLFLGRQLFWIFVGGAGFVAGLMLATAFLQNQPEWMALLVALLGGILGALLALFLQRLAVGLGGFFAGGYLVYTLCAGFGHSDFIWIAFLIGGVAGAVLVVVLFDWALIFLSSLTGAALIVNILSLDATLTMVAFLILFALGAAVQARQLRGNRPQPAASRV